MKEDYDLDNLLEHCDIAPMVNQIEYHAGYMRENQNLFDFEISDEDMKRINTIPQVGWSGEHPDRERVPVEQVSIEK